MSSLVLAGNLKFLTLGDILQLLGQNSSSGILRLKSKYAQAPGLIYIFNGNPVDASDGGATGLDALENLFGWLDGEFEFNEENVARKKVISKSRMEIILDGLSMLDDGQIEVLGPVSYDKAADDPSKEPTLPTIRGPLVDYMYVVDEEEAYDGSKITVEGKHGSWFWVILEGVAEISKETADGPLKLLRIGEGAFVGSIASFLVSGSVRGVTIQAIGNVQMGVLDSQRLGIDYSKMSPDFRSFVLSLDRRLKQVTDCVVDIHLQKSNIEDFVKDKKPFIKQGDSEAKLYVIEEGEACAVRQTEFGHVPLANFAKDDFFGNVPFLDMGQEPYSASILGSEDLKVKEMDIEHFRSEHDRLSASFKNIVEHLGTCIAVTTKMASDIQKKMAAKKSKKS